jgi:hypothetical protein
VRVELLMNWSDLRGPSRNILYVSASFLLFLGVAAGADAASLTLMWDPSPEAVGYVVFIGTAPKQYTEQVSTSEPRATIESLLDGTTYYFAVQAVGPTGIRSNASEEISGTTPALPPPAYRGFAGDGKPSIIWQHTNGWLAYWFLNGVTATGGNSLTPAGVPDPAWRVAGAADFTHDGYADLLLQNQATGDLFIWNMQGTTAVSGEPLSPLQPPGRDWRAVAVGDFNADGWPDVLFQHGSTGLLAVWVVKEGLMVDWRFLTPAAPSDPEWKAVAAADLNGDTRPDVVFQNEATGEIFVWYMDGFNLINGAGLKPGAPSEPGWKIVGIADLDADGWQDIVFQNSTSRRLFTWYMENGTAKSGESFVPASVSDPGWAAVAVK